MYQLDINFCIQGRKDKRSGRWSNKIWRPSTNFLLVSLIPSLGRTSPLSGIESEVSIPAPSHSPPICGLRSCQQCLSDLLATILTKACPPQQKQAKMQTNLRSGRDLLGLHHIKLHSLHLCRKCLYNPFNPQQSRTSRDLGRV